MYAYSFKITALTLVALCTLALLVLTSPIASASFANGSPISSGFSNDSDRGVKNMPAEDNRPYSVATIRECVSAHVPSGTASTTPSTISKEKGDTLIACIKKARQKVTNDAINDLIKKIDELRAQIEAIRKAN
jgi:N-acetylglucosamine-6-phosphate deacetylase